MSQPSRRREILSSDTLNLDLNAALCWADRYDYRGVQMACDEVPDRSSSLGLCAEHLARFRLISS